jgi:hypothetical protein
MKMIYITCNVSIREPLTAMLDENGVSNYQIIEQVPAKNVRGAPRLNTAVWPGHNTSIFMQFSRDEEAGKILKKLKAFNREAYNEDELIEVCMWPLDDYFYD